MEFRPATRILPGNDKRGWDDAGGLDTPGIARHGHAGGRGRRHRRRSQPIAARRLQPTHRCPEAQPTHRYPQAQPACRRPTRSAGLWSASYWATKQRDGQGIQLAVYRKRMGAPAPGQAALPVLVLVHGSSPAALASFDLTIPGNDGYSLMNVFARLGYDVWTLDHEGYGRSTRTDANSDIASGVADLVVATGLIMKETGQTRMHMMGESSGALRAGAFAMAHPERMGRLVLEAFTYTGEGSPTLGKRAEQLEYYPHP